MPIMLKYLRVSEGFSPVVTYRFVAPGPVRGPHVGLCSPLYVGSASRICSVFAVIRSFHVYRPINSSVPNFSLFKTMVLAANVSVTATRWRSQYVTAYLLPSFKHLNKVWTIGGITGGGGTRGQLPHPHFSQTLKNKNNNRITKGIETRAIMRDCSKFCHVK